MGLFDIFKKKPLEPNVKVKVTVSSPPLSPPRIPKIDRTSENPYPDSYQSDILEQRTLFRKAMKQALPSENGLYPHEILMLDYAASFYAQGENQFQGFWLYETHLEDPQAVLNSLEERGFIVPGDLESTLKNETAAMLKEELKRLELKVTGKKADLVQRLLDEGNREELEKRFLRRRYQLTELGAKELADNEYIPYIHRQKRYDLDIWSLNLLMAKPPKASYRDKIWGYFNEQSTKHIAEHNYGLYRNTRFNMCEFLLEEKRYQGAFQLIAEVLYWDLSGCDNGGMLDMDSSFMYESYLGHYFPYENSLATAAPGILSRLETLMTTLDISEEHLRPQLMEAFQQLQSPRHLFTKDECADIVLAELNKDIATLERIYKAAEKRFRKNAPRKR